MLAASQSCSEGLREGDTAEIAVLLCLSLSLCFPRVTLELMCTFSFETLCIPTHLSFSVPEQPSLPSSIHTHENMAHACWTLVVFFPGNQLQEASKAPEFCKCTNVNAQVSEKEWVILEVR